MGKIKRWLMNMDEHVVDAVNEGALNENDVVIYCKTHMKLPIDEKYIKETYIKYMGEDDDTK
tara:strand:- start:324 stop:509 length:186 start_codon:yes stop_codon:yes gene_type:complete